MYEFTGKVKAVGEVQTFASGFTKRELVVEEEREGNWPNVVAFAFKKDNVAKLDGVTPGMRVKVGFIRNCGKLCRISPRAAHGCEYGFDILHYHRLAKNYEAPLTRE